MMIRYRLSLQYVCVSVRLHIIFKERKNSAVPMLLNKTDSKKKAISAFNVNTMQRAQHVIKSHS